MAYGLPGCRLYDIHIIELHPDLSRVAAATRSFRSASRNPARHTSLIPIILHLLAELTQKVLASFGEERMDSLSIKTHMVTIFYRFI